MVIKKMDGLIVRRDEPTTVHVQFGRRQTGALAVMQHFTGHYNVDNVADFEPREPSADENRSRISTPVLAAHVLRC